MRLKNNLLVICGPTATGKTRLGIDLAAKFNGEIVNADSRQIYQGMDIGTGKEIENSKFNPPAGGQSSKLPLKNQKYKIGYYLLSGVPVWLYDLVEPDYCFSVADYIKCASLIIRDIWKRGKLPILVGGTGFYIRALVDGIETLGISPDWNLRRRLKDWSVGELLLYLGKLDPDKAVSLNISDRLNPRRLVRSIEVALVDKKIKKRKLASKVTAHKILMIGLKAPNNVLYRKVDKRVEKRVQQGIEKEINNLLKKDYHWQNSALGETLGYQEWKAFFKGKVTRKEVIQRWKYNEHAYARRQMTWFKKDKRIIWFDISKKNWQKRVELLVEKWVENCKLSSKGRSAVFGKIVN